MAVLLLGSKCSHDFRLSPLPVSRFAGLKNEIRNFSFFTGSTGLTEQRAQQANPKP